VSLLGEILRRRASCQPDKRAYTFLENGEVEGARLTYSELDRRSRAVAARLQRLGAERRRVLLVLDTGPGFLAGFFGSLYAGAVAVPAFRPGGFIRPAGLLRLAAIARDSECDFAMADEALPADVRALIEAEARRRLLWLPMESLCSEPPGAWREPQSRDDEVAFLQYTSGSTSEPRGVMVTHGNLRHNLAYAAQVEQNDDESLSVSWLPLHHDMGLVEGILQPLYSGYPAYIFAPEAFLQKPLRWLAAISRYRATNSGAPNFAYDLCVRKIAPEERRALDLSTWRVAYNGAEPVRAETLRSFFDAFGPCGFRWRSFYPVYGLAESTLVVTSGGRDDEPLIITPEPGETGADKRAPRVGCGRAQCGTELLIVNPHRSTRCAPEEIGEIWVRSPSNAWGYWNRPEESRRIFGARLSETKEGPFLRTGDLGFLRGGELFVVGRLKDVLVIRGRNHYPQDIEWTAEQAHTSIRAGGVAVFAVIEQKEEHPVLLAEVSGSGSFDQTLEQVRRAVLDRHGLRLHTIALLPPRTLFKTSSGKLQRYACRKAFLAGELPLLAKWEAAPANDPASLIATLASIPAGSVESKAPITNYLDSLGVVELAVLLSEKAGRDVSVSELLELETLDKIAALWGTPSHSAASRESEISLMRADSRLPPELRPSDSPPPLDKPRSLLLTGATGFLGAHLLRELLETSRAKVFCLVRDGGLERIEAQLGSYGLWERSFSKRIVPLRGDVTRPRLGLSEAAFEQLGRELGAIYHNAAAVNFIYPYRDLRATNVLGTLECLRLAFQGRAKRFHFVSSLSVCSTSQAREMSEVEDVLPYLEELHLGYAETKSVAEALVRSASERGLACSIYRLPLLSASGSTGRANPDDLLSRFIRGCVEMRSAPDLDIDLDACPVDFATRAIVRLSGAPPRKGLSVYHVRDRKPRHWRELVLWMNLFGYPMALEPYGAWLALARERAARRDHPLHPLIAFFSRRVGDTFWLERYERGKRAPIESEETDRALARLGLTCPRSSSGYIERSFSRFIDRGALPEPARPRLARDRREENFKGLARDWLARVLREHSGKRSLEILSIDLTPTGYEQSILTEITSWYARRGTGLYRAAISLHDANGDRQMVSLFLKVKPSDREVMEVAAAVAKLCGARLGLAFDRFKGRLGFTNTHLRELALYEIPDRGVRRHSPTIYGTLRDEPNERWVLALEDLESVPRSSWDRQGIEAAIRGLAAIHAIGLQDGSPLRREDWLRPVMTAESMGEMAELWDALADHARPFFQRWAGDTAVVAQKEALSAIHTSWEELERLPQTLIHNDFNPRNLVLRSKPNGRETTLCAYDWELATFGVPQHDLAELLCFVLSPSATEGELFHYLELHRRSLERETGVAIDRGDFRRGFELSLRDLIVNRFALYTLVHRLQSKPFLEQVIPNWLHLLRLLREQAYSTVTWREAAILR
jgi:thioester reductase-like protein